MNLNQITLPTLDVEKSTTFYKTLGFNLIVEAFPHYVRFECSKGDSTFSLHKVEQLENPSVTSIYFEVEDLKTTVNQLKEKDITFDTDIMEQSWLWNEIHLKDPSGNQIIIYNAGKNRKKPPWRIN